MPMGRRLSLLCCSCLPRKQRDNLSSRSLYPDQDSSGHDDYSDEDDYYPSHAQLESLAPSSSSSSQPYSNSFRNNNNPWPSGFSNGRFSKQSSRGSQQRKPNPFRTPYHDDSDEEGDGGEGGGGSINDTGGGGGSRDKGVGITSFAPYRDDSDSDDAENGSGAEAEDEERGDRRLGREIKMGGSREPKDESTSNGHGHSHGGSALQNPTRVHAKKDVSPYRVFDSSSTTTTTSTRARSARPPRNPQGKMRWHDGDISSDNEDGEADAEEVIDVDALIAEQVCAVLPCLCDRFLSPSPTSCFHFLSLLLPRTLGGPIDANHSYHYTQTLIQLWCCQDTSASALSFLPSLLSPLA